MDNTTNEHEQQAEMTEQEQEQAMLDKINATLQEVDATIHRDGDGSNASKPRERADNIPAMSAPTTNWIRNQDTRDYVILECVDYVMTEGQAAREAQQLLKPHSTTSRVAKRREAIIETKEMVLDEIAATTGLAASEILIHWGDFAKIVSAVKKHYQTAPTAIEIEVRKLKAKDIPDFPNNLVKLVKALPYEIDGQERQSDLIDNQLAKQILQLISI